MKSQVSLKTIHQLKSQSEEVSAILKIMSHPQRLMILCSLIDGEKTVGELEEKTMASQSAVSQFLKAMKLEGLIESRREGQFVLYRIADPRVLELMKSLFRIFCQ